jgi:hypothetical protein
VVTVADCSAHERDYPVLARMYLWAIRTKWFDFAYHLVVLYGISVCALGTLLVAAGAPVPMGVDLRHLVPRGAGHARREVRGQQPVLELALSSQSPVCGHFGCRAARLHPSAHRCSSW